MATITLTPAYGRDYTSSQSARADFDNGKDFIFHDLSSPYDGKPCSIRDFPVGSSVKIRYKNNTAITLFNIGSES